MTAPDVNDVRARFEAEFGKCPDAQLTRKGDGYLFTATDLRWQGYRAAHAELSGEVRELKLVIEGLSQYSHNAQEVRELVEALKLARDYAAYVQGEPEDLAVMDAALAKHTHQGKP